jgi:predicted RNA binding protein YcfA (HicA-like mRNA interferase family)
MFASSRLLGRGCWRFRMWYHRHVGRKPAELLEWAQKNPASVDFRELVRLVEALGYKLDRQRGSHQIFRHARVGLPIINLQAAGKNAKPYQVRQVLRLVEEYGLEVK